MGYSAAYMQVSRTGVVDFYNSANTEAITILKIVAWTNCLEFNE